MIHARDDYNRIQDPLADGPLRSALMKLANSPTGVLTETGRCPCILCGEECAANYPSTAIAYGTCSNPACATSIARLILDDAARMGRGSPIGADEPVFLVRANDQASAGTVRAWADTHDAQGGGGQSPISLMARAWAMVMDAWPQKKRADV